MPHPRHLLDHPAPLVIIAAQIEFDTKLERLEDRHEDRAHYMSKNLHWNNHNYIIDRPGIIKRGPHDAVQSAKWAREGALSGKLKTKRRLEAEKLAEELEEEAYETDYAEDEKVEVEGTEEGGQPFSAIVQGTGAGWENGDMIMEQDDFWEDEVDSGEEEERGGEGEEHDAVV